MKNILMIKNKNNLSSQLYFAIEKSICNDLGPPLLEINFNY